MKNIKPKNLNNDYYDPFLVFSIDEFIEIIKKNYSHPKSISTGFYGNDTIGSVCVSVQDEPEKNLYEVLAEYFDVEQIDDIYAMSNDKKITICISYKDKIDKL